MVKLPSVLTWHLKNIITKASLLCLLLFLTSFTNNRDQSSKIDPNIKIIDSNNSREKVYLHFDRPYYSSGDDIWFKVYLVDANANQQTALSKIVYVDLINVANEIIDSKEIHIEKGCGQGDFQLNDRLKSGQYAIRAYTNYMRNFDQAFFFRKSIQISSLLSTEFGNNSIDPVNAEIQGVFANQSSSKPDIQFLPEGGHLINGFHNRIGFKAIDANGKGIDIQGIIIDNYGNKVSAFKTSKFGLGLFNIIPTKNKSYQALINYLGQDYFYNIPKALNTGVVMQVREFENHYLIGIQSSLKNGVDKLRIIGYQKGEIVSEVHLKGKREIIKIKISKSDLNQGIAQFTLLDSDQHPICERLAFVENGMVQTKASLKLSKDSYRKRELVEIDLSLDKTIKNVDQTNMSLSITDVAVVDKNPYDLDIKSYLLLNSELKGNIENPGYYFINQEQQTKRNLDILMLTQGWRKYLFAQKLNDSLIQYQLDRGTKFRGRIIKDSNSKKTSGAEVSLVIKENDNIVYDKIETDLDGHFEFGDFVIRDSASIVIQVEKVKRNDEFKSPRNQYRIEMDSILKLDKPLVSYNLNPNQIAENDDFKERSRSFQSNKFIYKIDKNSELLDEVIVDQVEVKTERELIKEEIDQKIEINAALYRDPSNRLDFSNLGFEPWGNVLSIIQNRIPGVYVHGMDITIRGRSSIRTPSPPLYLLNNVPTDSTILQMSAQNVDFIDVLKGYKAAIYGSRASGGVIAIYTKNGTEKRFKSGIVANNGIINFIHPGSYKAREFYEPKYNINKPEHQRPDVRSTLCWRPNIEFDEEGKAKISFYAADIPTNYRVDVQGITSEGIPLTSEAFINID